MPNGPMKKKRPGRARPGARAADGLVRIQKVMATAGIASRRACEQMVEQGLVSVNGKVVVALPVLVDPKKDRIEVDGRTLNRIAPHGDRPVYVMLYKPRHTVSTSSDPEGRRTVTDLVEHPTGVRLYPVGRLDYDTMGLVLLTNDGELANKLTHPRYGIHKTYRALIKGRLSTQEVAQLEKAIGVATAREERAPGVKATGGPRIDVIKSESLRTVIDITLQEGRNEQVRRILKRVGCPVKKLLRIRLGPLALKGVSLGHWRELLPSEVLSLRRAVREDAKNKPPDRPRTRPTTKSSTGERKRPASKASGAKRGSRSAPPKRGAGRPGPKKKGRSR